MMFDIWRAISSPWNASRIIAVTATRGPAAPNPQTNRAMAIVASVGASAVPIAPTM